MSRVRADTARRPFAYSSEYGNVFVMDTNRPVVPPTELADIAWEAAHAANRAFDRSGELEAQLGHLRAVGDLGMSGITIDDGVFTELETRQTTARTEFDVLSSMAAPAMLMPESPFVMKDESDASRPADIAGALGESAAGHLDPHTEQPPSEVTLIDLSTFAEEHGYLQSQATRLWGAIKDLEISFNVHGLSATVREWVERDPRIHNLGGRGISFLADYINHRLPGIEPLAVKYPLEARTYKIAEVKDMQPDALLLDRVVIGDEENTYVSHVSFGRFLIARSGNPNSHSVRLFASLARILHAPLDEHRARLFNASGPTKMTEDLAFIGKHGRVSGKDRFTYEKLGGSPVWGIAPERFISLIEESERSPELREQFKAYTTGMRFQILDYVSALKELLQGSGGEPGEGKADR